MIDLDALEAVAKAATPGEWHRLAQIGPLLVRQSVDSGGEYVARGNSPADAAHIAAMSPATTLALIAELREARGDAAGLAEAIRLLFTYGPGDATPAKYETEWGDPGRRTWNVKIDALTDTLAAYDARVLGRT